MFVTFADFWKDQSKMRVDVDEEDAGASSSSSVSEVPIAYG